MLDSFKNLTSAGKGQRQHAEELATLIAAAKEERGALGALLTQFSLRSAKLSQMDKAFEQVGLKADSTTASVDTLGQKVAALDDRLKGFDLVEKRIESLIGQVTEAQKEAAEVLRLNPHFSLAVHKQRMPIKDPTVLERHIAALRKAGLK